VRILGVSAYFPEEPEEKDRRGFNLRGIPGMPFFLVIGTVSRDGREYVKGAVIKQTAGLRRNERQGKRPPPHGDRLLQRGNRRLCPLRRACGGRPLCGGGCPLWRGLARVEGGWPVCGEGCPSCEGGLSLVRGRLSPVRRELSPNGGRLSLVRRGLSPVWKGLSPVRGRLSPV
jgi:hypothetical protein